MFNTIKCYLLYFQSSYVQLNKIEPNFEAYHAQVRKHIKQYKDW